MPWLSLPYFAVSLTYLWFSLFEVEIEVRASYARIGFITTSLSQAVVLIFLFFILGKRHG